MRRSYLIALSIFVVLLGYVLLTQTGDKGFTTIKLPVLPKITADQINKIQIDQPQGKVVLTLLAKKWRLTEPINFPVDQSKLDNARRTLAEMRVTDLIAESSDGQADFGLNSQTAIGILVTGLQGQQLKLTLGKTNQAHTHTFVNLSGSRKVYQVLGDIPAALNLTAPEWRSLQIFDLSTDGIQKVTISQSKGTLAFQRTEEAQPGIVPNTPQGATPTALPAKIGWQTEGEKQNLDEGKVNQFLSALARLSGSKINDEPVAAAKPLATIHFKTKDGEFGLQFLAFEAKDKRYWVSRTDDKTVYGLEEYQAQNLLKTLKDLK
jgi:Domain of unknown function (DUF4340)